MKNSNLSGKHGIGKDSEGKNQYLVGTVSCEYPETIEEAVSVFGGEDAVFNLFSNAVTILAGNKIRQSLKQLVEEKGTDVSPEDIQAHLDSNLSAFPDFVTEKADRAAIGKARTITTVIDSVAKGFSTALGLPVSEWAADVRERFCSVVIPELEKKNITVDSATIDARLDILSQSQG